MREPLHRAPLNIDFEAAAARVDAHGGALEVLQRCRVARVGGRRAARVRAEADVVVGRRGQQDEWPEHQQRRHRLGRR